jgi:hypothetical protein
MKINLIFNQFLYEKEFARICYKMGNRCCIKQKILHKDKRGIQGARTSIIDDKGKTEKH